MDILTLELFDVTVSQALLQVRSALERHPGMPMRILVDSDEMLRLNLERFLERQGRPATIQALGGRWQLEVALSEAPSKPSEPVPELLSFTASAPQPLRPRPVLLLRSAFTPGDRALGRQLLLGVLEALEPGTPWVILAHDALDLLEDPRAMAIFHNLQERGIPVRISQTSLRFLGHGTPPFESMDDAPWQALFARGELTVV